MLIKNIKRMKRQLEKEGRKDEAKKFESICPLSFVLPLEYSIFAEEFNRNPGVYIMKPIGRAQGRGIFLFNRLRQISDWKIGKWRDNLAESYVVQKYVERPYLVGGKKFDLRIYVLVTSFTPLVAYMYREGFARFTFHRYTLNPRELDNSYVHLTNVAIQKTSGQYDEQGSKWHIRMLKMYLISRHGHEAVEQLFNGIQDLVIRSLQCVQRVMIQDKHCFELYGYDIIIDENLQPSILEVNSSPSLTADTDEDYSIKTHLLDDMLTVIDLEKRLEGNEERIGGFDLIWHDRTQFCAQYSNLGSFNDRDRVLRRIYKRAQQRQKQEVQQRQQSASRGISGGRRQFGNRAQNQR